MHVICFTTGFYLYWSIFVRCFSYVQPHNSVILFSNANVVDDAAFRKAVFIFWVWQPQVDCWKCPKPPNRNALYFLLLNLDFNLFSRCPSFIFLGFCLQGDYSVPSSKL
ncbi:hypothetical protein ABZP36_022431 [Zizania latifolia]